jgi:multiple sugar transport system permease protein
LSEIKHRLAILSVYTTLLLFLVFTIGPLLWLLSLSLKTQLQAFANPPLLVFQPTAQNYERLFSESRFLQYFVNSLIVAGGTTLGCLLVGAPAAYALVRLRTRFARVILTLLMVVRMAPAMTFIIPFFIAFSQLKLLDTHAGLILSYFTFNLPLVIWLLRSFFLDLPRSLEEAAIIDGATLNQVFIQVILPIAGPSLLSTGILTFVMSWNEFIFALILTRRQAVTAAIGIVNLMKYEGTEWGQMGAGAIVLAVPAIIIALFVGKYLASGLTQGAIKE